MIQVQYLIQRERNVGIDAKHLTHRVFERGGVHIPVQHILQHVQEGGIVVLDLDIRLGLQSQCRGGALAPIHPAALLLDGQTARPLVHDVQAVAEDGVQAQKQIPVVVGEEQRVGFILFWGEGWKLISRLETS